MSVFERLWKDTMDIYRWMESEINGVTQNVEQLIPPSGYKCHYSKGSLTETGEDGVPVLISSHMLFCSVGTVLEGDKVIVTQRDGKKVTLTVGEGFPYSGAMQYRVKRSDTA
jgi:hypothetical protein